MGRRLLDRLRRRAARRSAPADDLLADAPVGVAVFDSELRCVRANAAFAALGGATAAELPGRPLLRLLPGLPAEVAARLPALVARGESLTNVPLGPGGGAGPDRVADLAIVPGARRAVRVTVTDVTAQRRIESALIAERDYARALVDSMQAGVTVISAARELVDVNQRFCDMTGWTRAELIGRRPPFPHWPPESADANAAVLARAFEDGAHDADVTIRAADERRVPVIESAALTTGTDGEVTGAVVTFTDLTGRRDAERMLRRSERLKTAILEAALDCVVTVDAEGRIVDWNPAAERTFGHRREDAVGADMAELIIPADQRDAHRRAFVRHIATGEGDVLGRRIEVPAMRRGGGVFPIELTITRVEIGGAPVFTAYLRDLTERVRAQEALAESERRFRMLADTVPVLLWTTGADNRCDFLNKSWLAFTGRPMEEELGLGWLADVHRDDRERTLDTFISAVAARAPFEMELRLRRADGEYRWHLNRARPRLTGGGELIGYIGSCTDITERREAEQRALFLSEAGAVLAGSLDIEGTLGDLAGLAVPRMADGCIVSLAGEDGVVREVASAHVDPEASSLLAEIGRRWPAPADARLGSAAVVRRGTPDLVSRVSEATMLAHAQGPEHREALRRIGIASYMCVPLIARGRTLGALAFLSSHSGRRFADADLALAQDLAGRAALAIDNAASHRAAEEAGDRARRLAAEQGALRRVATAVAGENEPRAAFDLVAAEAAALFGAQVGAVARFEGGQAHIAGLWGMPREGAQALLRHAAAREALMRMAGSGRAARIPGEGGGPAGERAYADTIAVPVHVRRDVWGAVIAMRRDDAFPPGAEGALGGFADLVALAIGNSEAWGRLGALAATDALTGLANHRTFHDRLAVEVRRARRHGRPVALALIDIDHFKQINDTFGHRRGDAVLADIGRRLTAQARAGEVIARVGGEEFAWVLPESDALGGYNAAERARRAIAGAPFEEVGRVTVSIGVCDLDDASGDLESLLRRADGALYWAKANGRDLTCRYSSGVVEDLSPSERSSRLQRALTLAGLNALARAVDAKDRSTSEHSARVAAMSEQLAMRLGWSTERAGQLREAALLHDVGKIGIPDAILLKPGPLTDAEFEVVKGHAALGAEIAGEVLSAEQVSWVRSHHERPDGRGYPDGTTDPPQGARILAVADAWDAMTIARPYATPLAPADAIAECRRRTGEQFDAAAVEALVALWGAGELDAAPALRASSA